MASSLAFPQRYAITATQALGTAAAAWLAVALAGQALFVVYIVAFYGGAALAGNWARWNQVLAAGYVRGDTAGNAALAAHLALAALVTLGGPLQLLPYLRRHYPRWHRWNGRVYVTTVVVASLTGTYMLWTRKVAGDATQHCGTTLNGALIVLCAVMTVRYAMRRDLARHRRWALRLFLMVSGSWFFRVGLLFWIMLNGGPAGFDPATFTGPALSFLAFAESLLPLALLQLYLRARDGAHAGVKVAMAAGLTALTLAMGVGIAGAAMGMWLPHIQATPAAAR